MWAPATSPPRQPSRPTRVGSAELVLKEAGIVCGLAAAEAVFRALDPDVRFEALVEDGTPVERMTVVAVVSGPLRAILTGERVALNFLGRLSGIGTLTRSYVDAVAGTGVAILDTRKTTPGPARAREARGRVRRRQEPPLRSRRRRAGEGQPSRGRGLDSRRGRAAARGDRSAHRGRMRHARPGLRGAGGGGRRDPPRQHDAGGAGGARLRSRGDRRGSKHPAASRSRPSARSPRPASTRSRSAPSPIPPVHSTSHWS